MKIKIAIFFLLIFPITVYVQGKPRKNPPNVRMTKIWDAAEHNAFTDLIKFKGNYYCSFREGSGHIPGTDGVVRILKSSDAVNWTSIALLEKEGIDLRDPKLSITPEGKIMVIMGGSIYKDGELLGNKPHASFSDMSGKQFSNPEKISIDPEIANLTNWIWRVTWYNYIGYGIDYQGSSDGKSNIYLVRTKDGRYFEKVSKLELEGANESTIRFDEKGTMYVLIRRDVGDKMGVLAKSTAPFIQWEYTKLNYRLGGPDFVFTDNQNIIIGTRVYEANRFAGLLRGDKNGKFKKIFRFAPADIDRCGETGYPGMVLEKDRLLVSYYSSHEGKPSIYIAEVPLNELSKPVE